MSALHFFMWHSRGYLPHFEGGERWQFVTLHLGDAMPQTVLESYKQELAQSLAKDVDMNLALRRKIERYLDAGYGSCFLGDERVAEVVQHAMLHFHEKRYRLGAWVIMPNHTHFLIKPRADFALSQIMQSIKSYTASEANKVLQRTGKFWQQDYFDRYIRDTEHFEKTVAYIERNPVKAGLCERPNEWRFGSAYSTK